MLNEFKIDVWVRSPGSATGRIKVTEKIRAKNRQAAETAIVAMYEDEFISFHTNMQMDAAALKIMLFLYDGPPRGDQDITMRFICSERELEHNGPLMVELGLVERVGGLYRLTDLGKQCIRTTLAELNKELKECRNAQTEGAGHDF